MNLRGVLLACVAAACLWAAPANSQTSSLQNLSSQPPGQLIGNLTNVAQPLQLSSIVLAWNPSPDPAVAGYILYEGLASQNYTNSFDVGNATSATISQLLAGTTYYFAVAAYDTNQVQSLLSTEVSYQVPSIIGAEVTLHLTMTGNRQALLTGNAPAGYSYNVQASRNLNTWTNIGSTTADASGSLQFTDSNAVGRMNFYRLLQTAP